VNSDVLSRWLKTVLSGGYGQLVTLGVQLASVPILISAWTLDGYGEWLAISAVPIYLGMFDFGISNTAANSMAITIDRRERADIYRSGLLLVVLFYFVIEVVFLIVAFFLNWKNLFGIASLDNSEIFRVLCVLSIHVILIALMTNMSGIYRAEKRLPFFNFIMHTTRLFEWTVASVVAVSGYGFFEFAICLLLIRLFGIFLTLFFIHRVGAIWYIVESRFSFDIARKLLVPSIANFSSGLSLMLNVQGVIIMLSVLWSSSDVAIFNVVRILTRSITQAGVVVSQASWPEISYAYSEGRKDLADRIKNRSVFICLALSFFLSMLVYLFSDLIFSLWLSKEIDISDGFLILMLASSSVYVYWQVGWVYLMAINKHVRFSWMYTVISTLGLGVIYFAAISGSFNNVAVALLVIELVTAFVVRYCVAEVGREYA
jgi:O-antigen/teichoic acid export membrane protein